MKTKQNKIHLSVGLLALAVFVATAISARAQDRNWNVASGNFNTAGNWDPSGVPTTGQAVFIGGRAVSANATVTLDSSTHTVGNTFVGAGNNSFPDPDVTLNLSGTGSLTPTGLYIGQTRDATGTVNQSGGTMAVGTQFRIGVAFGAGRQSTGIYNLSGGTLSLNSGFIELGHSLDGSGSTVGTFNLTGGTVTADAMTIRAGSSLTDNGVGSLNITSITNEGTITFNNASAATRTNTISGTGALTKDGAGVLTLTGTNTYTGNTTVSAGGLLINGSTAAGSAVTVASGAVIGGDGTINGNLSLSSGALFAFDAGNTLTLGGSSTFALDSTFGVASLRNLSGAALNWDSIGVGTYTLLTGGNLGSNFFNDTNIDNFGITNALTGLGTGGDKSAYFQNGSLQLVVIPEPSTWALLAVSLTAFVLFRRRRGAC